MVFNARVDVNCGWKDGRTDIRTDGLTDGQKTGHLYRTLLTQVRHKLHIYASTIVQVHMWETRKF